MSLPGSDLESVLEAANALNELYARFPIGSTIGRYIVQQVIGEGAAGVVFLAAERDTQNQVAIKAYVKCKKNKYLASREVALLGRCRHKHIVNLIEIVESGENIFLVMELVPGGELLDYVTANDGLPEAEACRLFSQLISAVAYMHSCRIVNRDLKLENILLDHKNNIKVIDFSVGAFFDSNHQELKKSFCGSPDYAAPEIWENREYVGPEIDVWCCGVVLYGMFVGHLPFSSVDDLVDAKYEIPPFIPPDCRHLIEWLLCRDPKARATIPEVMFHPWLLRHGYTNAKDMVKYMSHPASTTSPRSLGKRTSLGSTSTTNSSTLDSETGSYDSSSSNNGKSGARVKKWKLIVQFQDGRKVRIPISCKLPLSCLADEIKKRTKSDAGVVLSIRGGIMLHLEDRVMDALDEGEVVFAEFGDSDDDKIEIRRVASTPVQKSPRGIEPAIAKLNVSSTQSELDERRRKSEEKLLMELHIGQEKVQKRSLAIPLRKPSDSLSEDTNSESGSPVSGSMWMSLKSPEHQIHFDRVAKRPQYVLSNISVLVVENDIFSQSMIEGMFHIVVKNCTVTTVGDGSEAVQLCKVNRYNLILIDTLMPGMNGFEAASLIRQSGENTKVVIIGLSSDGAESDRDMSLKVGMDDFMRKPLWQSDLRGKLLLWKSHITRPQLF